MPRSALGATLAALVMLLSALPARAVDLPPDFVIENATPGLGWNLPVAVCFLPDGRWLVAEKRGVVWVVKNGLRHPVPMWNGELEVMNHTDRGLLGMAVHPDFANHPYLYLLYTVDPDSSGVDTSYPTFGRLTRYRVSASDSNAVDPSTRTILLGRTWSEGPLSASPSHTIGTLRFGTDGSLFVGCGDGAFYTDEPDDGGDTPSAFLPGRTDPSEDIGSFRAQYLGSLCGKILRIDPQTGEGYPSNPFWDGDPLSVRSRVWAYGLRNPFRFAVEPGSGGADPSLGSPGVLHIGDVGWALWEELDIATQPGRNFGWPCYEGPLLQTRNWAPRAAPAHCGCDSLGVTNHSPVDTTGPVAAWYHYGTAPSIPPGYMGRTALGGTFYGGRRYPPQYRNRLFMGDFGESWIKVLVTDSQYRLDTVLPFADAADNPVEILSEPGSGDILYISIATGEIRRIRYVGPVDNVAPVAQAAAAPPFGTAPLAVAFSSEGTKDAEGDSLTHVWLFGDGNGSTSAAPAHVYADPGVYAAVLTATDTFGGLDRDTLVIVVAPADPFPGTAVLDSFERADGPPGAPWSGDPASLGIVAGALVAVDAGSAHAIWDEPLPGPAQEVFVDLVGLPAGAASIDLLLKAQGAGPDVASLAVRYDVAGDRIEVRTREAGADPVVRGSFAPAGIAAGDRLGARVLADGLVAVYRNDVMIGGASVADWPLAGAPGRIGIAVANAAGATLDDFGGGAIAFAANTPPMAKILTPPDSSFYADGDTVWLAGEAGDAEDPASSLALSWEVDLHHNVHVHPAAIVIAGGTGSFLGESHDDGTGVHLRARFIAADPGGLRDTTAVDLFPEVDLRPVLVSIEPASPFASDSALVRFRLVNDGRMLAPRSTWRLSLGDSLVAEGDTIVTARDSVTLTRTIATPATAGEHELRLVADALHAVVETDATNDATSTVLAVRPPPDVVSAGPVTDSITVARPTVVVPFRIARSTASPPLMGFSVAFRISAPLVLPAGGSNLGFPPGGGDRNGEGDRALTFFAVDLGGGTWRADGVTLGQPCGSTALDGTLFVVELASAADVGLGTVEVLSVQLRDCRNVPIPGEPGDAAVVVVDRVPPAVPPPGNLVAMRQPAGNSPGPTIGIALSWDAAPPGTTVEVWRAPFGHYPEYDEAGGVEPVPSPTYPPGAPWQLTGVTAPGEVDVPVGRDFYHYVAYARDALGSWSAASNPAGGTLNYVLGDVTDGVTAGLGDNLVTTADVSRLGAFYGLVGAAMAPQADLDVGPTTTLLPDGRPLTDQRLDFEDLVIFALNHEVDAVAPGLAAVAMAADTIELVAPAHATRGAIASAGLDFRGAGALVGLSVRLAWDPAIVEPVGQRTDDWLAQRRGIALSPTPGVVDVAALAPARLAGAGRLATVMFRAIADGDPGIRIAAVEGRDARNRRVIVASGPADAPPPAPLRTALRPTRPNPFRESALVAFSLAAGGPIDVTVHAVDGRRVRELVQEVRGPGSHGVVWDGRDDHGVRVPPGVYYVHLTTAGGTFAQKVVHLE